MPLDIHSERPSRAERIRASLGHPVIDGDGHMVEYVPLFLEYLKDLGGPDIAARFAEDRRTGGWYALTPGERLERRVNRPSWWGGFSLVWRPIARVTFGLRARFVGRVYDSSIPTGRVALSSYERVDLAVSWQVREPLTIYLAVDNVLDADYQEAVGFPSVGIRLRIGLQLRW